MRSSRGFSVAGLFAGIGGIELGLGRQGGHAEVLCESWEPARKVLSVQFAGVPLVGDIREVRALPRVDVVAAGFPCTDLSQAGRTTGIGGEASGLVCHVFRLLRRASRQRVLPTWIVIENVANMLQLDRGEAMRYLVTELEALDLRWAYRVVDSRFTGVPQRRRRVLLVASRTEDPRSVLFTDDAGERHESDYGSEAFGFYWTEGVRGLGWAQDAVPTLKGGSTIGIPSPPAIWVPSNELGRKLVTPNIDEAEVLQDFPPGWTRAADEVGRTNGPRWKLVGNAVTAGVAEWLGRRLVDPGDALDAAELWHGPRSWPTAAYGVNGKVWKVSASEFPVHWRYRHLTEAVDVVNAKPMTHRGTAGFWRRLQQGNLGRYGGFREDVAEHLAAVDPTSGLSAAG